MIDMTGKTLSEGDEVLVASTYGHKPILEIAVIKKIKTTKVDGSPMKYNMCMLVPVSNLDQEPIGIREDKVKERVALILRDNFGGITTEVSQLLTPHVTYAAKAIRNQLMDKAYNTLTWFLQPGHPWALDITSDQRQNVKELTQKIETLRGDELNAKTKDMDPEN